MREAYAALAGERVEAVAPVIVAIAPYVKAQQTAAIRVLLPPVPRIDWQAVALGDNMQVVWRAIEEAQARIADEEDDEDMLLLLAA